MALFGGFQERREKKALDHYFTTLSVDATQIEELAKACPQAAAHLHEVLKGPPDRDKRFRALLGLQSLGITPEMVPSVLDALRDEDDLVQETAAKILGANRQYAATVLPVLMKIYAENAAARPIVLQIFGEYGPDARPAIPLLLDGLRQPTHALEVARCLAHIGLDDLDPVQRAIVEVLADRAKGEDARRLPPEVVPALEAFLVSFVPWRTVDGIPAWRRALEAYAELCASPPEPIMRVLIELVNSSDWKLRGEVGAQFLEMSRAKMVAEKVVRPQ